jgi:hypothetical protein
LETLDIQTVAGEEPETVPVSLQSGPTVNHPLPGDLPPAIHIPSLTPVSPPSSSAPPVTPVSPGFSPPPVVSTSSIIPAVAAVFPTSASKIEVEQVDQVGRRDTPGIVEPVYESESESDFKFGVVEEPVLGPLLSEPAGAVGLMEVRVPGELLVSPEPASSPDPVVNVTIGRVEVRASSPPPPEKPSPRPKKPSGIISLDKYLSQRSRAAAERGGKP